MLFVCFCYWLLVQCFMAFCVALLHGLNIALFFHQFTWCSQLLIRICSCLPVCHGFIYPTIHHPPHPVGPVVRPGVRNTEACRGSSMRRMCQLEKLWLWRVPRRGQVRKMELPLQFCNGQILAQNIGQIGSSDSFRLLKGTDCFGGPAELEDLWTPLAVIPAQ